MIVVEAGLRADAVLDTTGVGNGESAAGSGSKIEGCGVRSAGKLAHPRKRPKQERSTRLVEDVLEAAERVLAKEGAQQFTTTRVAKVAGVSVGSIYQYFANKESILVRMQIEEWRTNIPALLSILEGVERSPIENLIAAVETFLQSEREEAPLRAALADAAPVFWEDREAAKYRHAVFRRFLLFWRRALPEARATERRTAIDVVVTTVAAAGERIGSRGGRDVANGRFAAATSNMVCAFVRDMQVRTSRR